MLVALPGDYGKPCPAVVVQAAPLNEANPDSYLLCPLTTTLTGLGHRPQVEPTTENALGELSEMMADKLTAAPRKRISRVIGRLSSTNQEALDRAILLVLGFA